jgi:hypothetical protein
MIQRFYLASLLKRVMSKWEIQNRLVFPLLTGHAWPLSLRNVYDLRILNQYLKHIIEHYDYTHLQFPPCFLEDRADQLSKDCSYWHW